MTVKVCPKCDTANPYQRRPSIQDTDTEHTYRCEHCDHRFDTPDEREAKSRDCIPDNTLAARLADPNTTPEDLGL